MNKLLKCRKPRHAECPNAQVVEAPQASTCRMSEFAGPPGVLDPVLFLVSSFLSFTFHVSCVFSLVFASCFLFFVCCVCCCCCSYCCCLLLVVVGCCLLFLVVCCCLLSFVCCSLLYWIILDYIYVYCVRCVMLWYVLSVKEIIKIYVI